MAKSYICGEELLHNALKRVNQQVTSTQIILYGQGDEVCAQHEAQYFYSCGDSSVCWQIFYSIFQLFPAPPAAEE